MKTLVCEMCNSNDLLKTEDIYVCQNCGTKYSVEDAKKLFVEVSGKVQIDNSNQVIKDLENARIALRKENWPEADRCYTFVEQNDPNNIEAIFYSAYARAMDSLTVNVFYRRQAVFKALYNSFDIIIESYDISEEVGNKEILPKICQSVFKMYTSSYVYTITKNLRGDVTDSNSNETKKLFVELLNTTANALTKIIELYPQEQQKSIAYIYELRVNLYLNIALLPEENILMQNSCYNLAKKYSDAWKVIDPSCDTSKVQNAYAAWKSKLDMEDKKGKRGAWIVAGVLFGIATILIVIMITTM